MNFWEAITDYKYGIFNRHWWNDLYYKQISSRLNPRNKWLTKQIPRTWQDKDHILEICVLEALKHYVEGEKCFEVLSTKGPPEQVKYLREVLENYEAVKYKLPALEKQLEEAWDAIPSRHINDINKSTKEDYDRTYGKIDALDEEIYNLKTKVMLWVVEYRNGLWT